MSRRPAKPACVRLPSRKRTRRVPKGGGTADAQAGPRTPTSSAAVEAAAGPWNAEDAGGGAPARIREATQRPKPIVLGRKRAEEGSLTLRCGSRLDGRTLRARRLEPRGSQQRGRGLGAHDPTSQSNRPEQRASEACGPCRPVHARGCAERGRSGHVGGPMTRLLHSICWKR